MAGTQSLWPDFPNAAPPPGLRQMLYDAAADIKDKTNGVVHFYVDTMSGRRDGFRYDCYLRVERAGYNYLLFRAETDGPDPFPARVASLEDGIDETVTDEAELQRYLAGLFNRPETKTLVLQLLANFG